MLLKHKTSHYLPREKTSGVRVGGDWAALSQHANIGYTPSPSGQLSAMRIRFTAYGFVLLFAIFMVRLGFFTLVTPLASDEMSRVTAHEPATRTEITDRHGKILATQIVTTTLSANAREIARDGEADMLADALVARLPKIAETRMRRFLREGRLHRVELMKSLTPQQKQAVLELGNPSLILHEEKSRIYPDAALASHVVGFADSYFKGLAGLEARIDADGIDDATLRTTLDASVQFVVHDALARAMVRYRAKAAAGIIIDAHSGAVLAMVSLPDFDPNHPTATPPRNRFNHAVQGAYELGSIFKIFTAAMALESGRVSLDERFDTARPLQIGKYQIADEHGQARALNLAEIVAYSSNIGAAKLALRLTPDEHLGFLQSLGLTERLHFDLPESTAPILPAHWRDIERVTTSYGHGIAVTPLQFLSAAAAMVNGGILYEPHIIPPDMFPYLRVGKRVISPDTSSRMREIMRGVVRHGTGRNADVAGYGVIGKTGSANKPERGGYSEVRLVTSFVGAFPADAPRYAMLVMLDEPQPTVDSSGYALAGWNAAPTARRIIARSAPLLGLLPRSESPSLVEANYRIDGGGNAP